MGWDLRMDTSQAQTPPHPAPAPRPRFEPAPGKPASQERSDAGEATAGGAGDRAEEPSSGAHMDLATTRQEQAELTGQYKVGVGPVGDGAWLLTQGPKSEPTQEGKREMLVCF